MVVETHIIMRSEDATMKAIICCEPTERGVHSFYLIAEGHEYFLFRQGYRKGVQEYFSKGVIIALAMDYSKAHNDSALKSGLATLNCTEKIR